MKNTTLLTGFLGLILSVSANAQSAYLPSAGEFEVTPSYQYSSYDSFFEGTQKIKLSDAIPFDEKITSVGTLTLSYGITGRFTFDVSSGYVYTEVNDGPTDEGWADSQVGVRYALLDEAAGAPLQATLKIAGIFAGTYETGDLFSVGPGENGFETALLFGKRLGDIGGLYGDFGYRYYGGNVPEQLFGAAGAYVNVGPATLSAGYRHTQSLDGGDISGKGFGTSFNVVETKQISQNLEIGLGISDPRGRYYQLFYSRTLDGRNVDERDTFGIAITFPFGGSRQSSSAAPVSYSGK